MIGSPQMGYSDQQQLQSVLESGWRLTPATMAHKITNGRWIPARHLLHISTIVATEVAKGGARILMTMPPRHGKSEFLSVNTPIWFLEHWPEKYVMGISYGLELATDFSLKVRTAFLDEDLHGLLTTRLRKEKRLVDRFLTTGGGGMTAAGIGGPITGRGGDLLYIDDYIKNAETALSKGQRDNMWEWFKSTAWTRLEPNASVIILATRWDVDDLIARCLTEMEDENWILINLPAIAEINDRLGRKEGEALWPERYDEKALGRIEKVLGSYWWSAMYQQNPKASMSGADLGDKLTIISESELPQHKNTKSVRAWDLAATEGGGDYTNGMKMMLDKDTNRIYIVHNLRFRKSAFKTETMIQTVADGDGYGVLIEMEQEPGSSGKIVIAHYEKEILKGFAFHGEKATGPIEVRAQPFMAAIEAGNVYAVRADWNKDLKEELNAFPDGDHDDQMVSGALAYHKLVKNRFGGLTWGRERGVAPTERLQAIEGEQQPKISMIW